MAYRKINSKAYQVMMDDEWRTIKTPYQVTADVFAAFVNSGVVTADGELGIDALTFMTSFGAVANMLLAERDEKGRVTQEGNYGNLSIEEMADLFEIGKELVANFMQLLSEKAKAAESSEPKSEN